MKDCAICGSKPNLKLTDMGKPNGRGYPGCHFVGYICNNCGMPNVRSSDTVYHDMEEALKIAETNWETEITRIETYLNNKNVPIK